MPLSSRMIGRDPLSPTDSPELTMDTLATLEEGVYAPLIVCEERRPNSGLPGRVLTANPMACAMLNRNLADVQAQPLASLVATASGRPPPPGLVSKCTVYCWNAPPVPVQCDCYALEGIGSTPLLFYHLALMDWNVSAETADGHVTGHGRLDEDAAGGTASLFVRALAEVHIERLKILLVEDDPFSVVAIQELCGECHFELRTVGGGEECLDTLEEDMLLPAQERINLVMCDVMMQGMDGHEVLTQIRKRFGDEIAVIMISSNDQHDMVEACIRAGADSYLFKPLRMSDFSNVWQFVMQRRTHKLQAAQSEMRYVRSQQRARTKQLHAEKLRLIAQTEVRAQRERARVEAERQQAAQETKLTQQRAQMQAEIMQALHQQVRKYCLLARTCSEIIVHVADSQVQVHLSHECKAKLGYAPSALNEASHADLVHPDDLNELSRACACCAERCAPDASHSDRAEGAVIIPLRLKCTNGAWVQFVVPMHAICMPSGCSMIGAVPRVHQMLDTARPDEAAGAGGAQSAESVSFTAPAQASEAEALNASEALSGLLADAFSVITVGRPGEPSSAVVGEPRSSADKQAASGVDLLMEPIRLLFEPPPPAHGNNGRAQTASEKELAPLVGTEQDQPALHAFATGVAAAYIGGAGAVDGSPVALSLSNWSTVAASIAEAATDHRSAHAHTESEGGSTSALGDTDDEHSDVSTHKPAEERRSGRSVRPPSDLERNDPTGDSTNSTPHRIRAYRAGANQYATLASQIVPGADDDNHSVNYDDDDDSDTSAPSLLTADSVPDADNLEAVESAKRRMLAEAVACAKANASRSARARQRQARRMAHEAPYGKAEEANEETATRRRERESIQIAIGRASVRHTQELAKEALVSYFRSDSSQPASPLSSRRGSSRPAEAWSCARGGEEIDAVAADSAGRQSAASSAGADTSAAGAGDSAHAASAQAHEGADDDVGQLHLQLLKKYFVSQDASQMSPLALASHKCGPSPLEPIRALLRDGADVNEGGPCGWPPLSLALLGGDANLPAVQVLLAANAKLEACPKCRPQQTPLLLAAAARQEACTHALIEAGAKINARDHSGKPALVLCAAWTPDDKARRACILLLDRSADVCLRDADGEYFAHSSALGAGNAETAKMLLERAAAASSLARQLLLEGEEDQDPRKAKSTTPTSSRKGAKGGGAKKK